METFTVLVMTKNKKTGKEQSEYFKVELPEHFSVDASAWVKEKMRSNFIKTYTTLFIALGKEPILVDGKFDYTERIFRTSM